MLSETQINEILSDICNFQLVVFGIAVSLFTLLFSFIMSKREQLKVYSNEVKLGNSNPETFQKIEFCKSYISRLRRTNRHLMIISVSTLSIYLFSWVSLRLIDCLSSKLVLFKIAALLSILMIIYIVLILWYVLYKEYSKSTKI